MPVSDMPALKYDEHGKAVKTPLQFHQVINTLLSGDDSKYIEVSTFTEPEAPDTKLLIMIPPDPNCTPGYRYYDPYNNRALNGTLRHEVLLGIVKRHDLLLCSRSVDIGKPMNHSLTLGHYLSHTWVFHILISMILIVLLFDICAHLGPSIAPGIPNTFDSYYVNKFS